MKENLSKHVLKLSCQNVSEARRCTCAPRAGSARVKLRQAHQSAHGTWLRDSHSALPAWRACLLFYLFFQCFPVNTLRFSELNGTSNIRFYTSDFTNTLANPLIKTHTFKTQTNSYIHIYFSGFMIARL